MSEYLKKTKIIATLGPASSNKETILRMVQAGADVIRINFSHADYDLVTQNINLIREINAEYGFSTSILGDLQGPKLRVGVVKEGSYLNPGDVLTFTNEKVEGDSTKVYMTYERFPLDVKVGERILIDDGKLVLEVIDTNGKDTVKAKTIQGGPLSSKKGVNLPNTQISLPALTEKDIQDANFILDNEFDWIALSFVRHAQDIIDLKELISNHPNGKLFRTPIIAKIEKPEGVKNIDEILAECDGIMVARGDLGVEVPMEEVPLIQKKLAEKARKYSKPVIVATQMMETMINSMTPTRAEVNDVANSVLDGADAVMLSGETSVGKYPVDVVKTMAKIVSNIENTQMYSTRNEPIEKINCVDDRFITDSVCYSAVRIAEKTDAKAIVTLTYSGYTAFQISSHRPNSHIVVFSSNKRVLTMLNLLWGVRAFFYDMKKSTDETVIQVNMLTWNYGLVEQGDFVVNLNAMPVHEGGKTNTLRLTTI
ncbi:pyruvate kinase [Elizabethkingia ursingii]|jgi:pyruvate kinase|uniref:Pyruvate kinase n=1 Tax=Elizabethkingia ursingii TaxID=1756150 RepID=A0AAJ3NBR2_9FLAO|nr:pyruvate kinase [Elizabethkingia ursingii]AQX09143.1 pyruvate kinase [Elizabethkingia ursingii]MCL1662733.1 pyruvate kinase [Elizabethkingia ursingii]MCL1670191.1 pyruvate kinase [Elizabethkingia ursingii]OPB74489.1 pyruvate kinase [Elizabethkingia ursingii]OPB93437.1 pyruvate kinase [Elizabethkingia ursingii]